MRLLFLFAMLASFGSYSESFTLKYLDEFVIPADLTLEGDKVGGLSSIEYHDGKYYLIVDDSSKPRYLQADIIIKNNKFELVQFERSFNLIRSEQDMRVVDPESLRLLPNGQLVWSSEGSVKHKHAPAIFIQTHDSLSLFTLPDMFDIKEDSGPRHNAVFEGLTLSHDQKGIWVSMEGALKQDGEEASLTHGSAVRITYFDFESKQSQMQFAYWLEPIVDRADAKPDAFRTTGLVELLQLSENQFLAMERSYTGGIEDGGNNVSIYLANIEGATNTSKMDSLKGQEYKAAEKSLVLDLESIKGLLGSKRVDNLEGMALGPILPNGNQSLLLVSDNNFNLYGKQISQILLFEIQSKNKTPSNN
jgi:hypothetical protein